MLKKKKAHKTNFDKFRNINIQNIKQFKFQFRCFNLKSMKFTKNCYVPQCAQSLVLLFYIHHFQ